MRWQYASYWNATLFDCEFYADPSFTLREHQSFLSKMTVSKVSDSVSQYISMKENIFKCVPESWKDVTEITLD